MLESEAIKSLREMFPKGLCEAVSDTPCGCEVCPYNSENEECEVEPIQRKKKYTIRMDITFCKEVTQEEAERLIFNAISRAGVTGHCGGLD